MYFDLHVRGWLDEAERSVVRMSVHQPDRDRDVVVLTLDKHHRFGKDSVIENMCGWLP